MAEAVAEKPQATEQPTNGTAEKTTEVAAEKPKVSAEEKKADENDEHEQYSADKRDDRNKERGDFRKHDRNYDDRRDRDRRDGGRGRGRGRGRGGDRGRGGRGGGRGRGGFRGGYRQDNIRTDYRRLEETDDATEIRRQVEFYFSDSNLPIDKFLLQQTGGHDNNPVPLKTIHNFKRMQHFQPYSAVVEAVKNSNFLALTDDEEVYRRRPLDEKFTLDPYDNEKLLTSQSMLRSIYAKGFGEETATTQFDIEEYFSPYGSAGVRLRRQKDGTFKGSVFAEFESEEAAQQFLEMENKPAYGPDEKELTFKSKKEYVDGKTDDILEGRVKPNSPTRRYSHHHRNDRQNSNGHGRRASPDYGFKRKRDGDDEGFDGDDWRARRDRFQSDRRNRDDSRSRSRSPYHERRRSRSPFRHPKNGKEDKAGEKKESPAEEAKAEQTEAATAEETKDTPAEEAKTEATEAKEVEASS